MGAGVEDDGVLVGIKIGVGLGPGVRVKNERVGGRERSGGTVGTVGGVMCIKVGMAVGVRANSVNAADNAVSFTLTVGIACGEQATSATVKMIEKPRPIVSFDIMNYQLDITFTPDQHIRKRVNKT